MIWLIFIVLMDVNAVDLTDGKLRENPVARRQKEHVIALTVIGLTRRNFNAFKYQRAKLLYVGTHSTHGLHCFYHPFRI